LLVCGGLVCAELVLYGLIYYGLVCSELILCQEGSKVSYVISRVCRRSRYFVGLDLGLRGWKDAEMRGLMGLEFRTDVFEARSFLTISRDLLPLSVAHCSCV
jgi:hypothetical protein